MVNERNTTSLQLIDLKELEYFVRNAEGWSEVNRFWS